MIARWTHENSKWSLKLEIYSWAWIGFIDGWSVIVNSREMPLFVCCGYTACTGNMQQACCPFKVNVNPISTCVFINNIVWYTGRNVGSTYKRLAVDFTFKLVHLESADSARWECGSRLDAMRQLTCRRRGIETTLFFRSSQCLHVGQPWRPPNSGSSRLLLSALFHRHQHRA